MPHIYKGPLLLKYFSEFIQKINQVIYSSLPISSPSFKTLASIVFFLRYFADKEIYIFSKGHNSGKGQH